MARVLLCSLDYVIVDNALAISTEERSADIEITIRSLPLIPSLLTFSTVLLGITPRQPITMGKTFAVAQLLFNVFSRLLVLPGLLPMGIGQADPVFVPDCDADDHQPILVFDNQIQLLQIAATFTAGSKKVENLSGSLPAMKCLISSCRLMRLLFVCRHIHKMCPDVSLCILHRLHIVLIGETLFSTTLVPNVFVCSLKASMWRDGLGFLSQAFPILSPLKSRQLGSHL